MQILCLQSNHNLTRSLYTRNTVALVCTHWMNGSHTKQGHSSSSLLSSTFLDFLAWATLFFAGCFHLPFPVLFPLPSCRLSKWGLKGEDVKMVADFVFLVRGCDNVGIGDKARIVSCMLARSSDVPLHACVVTVLAMHYLTDCGGAPTISPDCILHRGNMNIGRV